MPLLGTILRRSFFAAATVSTLLLLATLIVWPVSYGRELAGTYGLGGDSACWLSCYTGRISLEFQSGWSPVDRGFQFYGPKVNPLPEGYWSYITWNMHYHRPGSALTSTVSLGIAWEFYNESAEQEFICDIPCSYLALLFSILPLLAFRSIHRRAGAARVGLCPKCGYDLRAQRAGAGGVVCSECGAPVTGRKEKG
jgi:hypothetical protein